MTRIAVTLIVSSFVSLENKYVLYSVYVYNIFLYISLYKLLLLLKKIAYDTIARCHTIKYDWLYNYIFFL